jgi:L,D-transpeptidase ErfK/SrfK
VRFAVVIGWFIASGAVSGAPAGDDEVIGSIRFHRVRSRESLIEIARDYDIGFNEIAAANPRLDAFVPPKGAKVVIPTAFILPSATAPGIIVVNLSEMRLYYRFRADGEGQTLFTAPIGTAIEGRSTPLGTFWVTQKQLKPHWYPPPSVRKEQPELPPSVPPGPDNPLGTHAMRLSSPRILIHGTNRPFGVGRRVSHGCIRLYPEDIVRLYRLAPVGTKVRVVREPVKVGLSDKRVYVQVHADPDVKFDYASLARQLLWQRGLADKVDSSKLETVLRKRNGIPAEVTREELATRPDERTSYLR